MVLQQLRIACWARFLAMGCCGSGVPQAVCCLPRYRHALVTARACNRVRLLDWCGAA